MPLNGKIFPEIDDDPLDFLYDSGLIDEQSLPVFALFRDKIKDGIKNGIDVNQRRGKRRRTFAVYQRFDEYPLYRAAVLLPSYRRYFMLVTPFRTQDDLIQLIRTLEKNLSGYRGMEYRFAFGVSIVYDRTHFTRRFGDEANSYNKSGLYYAIFSSAAGNSYNISGSISKHVVLSLFPSISHARVSFSTVQVSKKT